jgi:hypothetical protein
LPLFGPVAHRGSALVRSGSRRARCRQTTCGIHSTQSPCCTS